MDKRFGKKITSLIVIMIMVMTMLPTTAFATDESVTTPEEVTDEVITDEEIPGDPETPEEPAQPTVRIENLKTDVSKKAGKELVNKIKIYDYPVDGSIRLEMKHDGEWLVKQEIDLPETEPEEGIPVEIKLAYPKIWYSTPKSSWRVSVIDNDNNVIHTEDIKVQAERVYQTSGKYLKVQFQIPVRKSGYNLKVGMSGLKVYWVQKKLKCYYGKSKYTTTTKNAVKKFQRKKGLKATGIVNKTTWMKLGYSERNWYYLDSYVTPSKVKLTSTRTAHINAMIKTAKSYLGTKYRWCASGKPGQAVDCAGLVLQCMYAAGIDPLPSGSHVYAYKSHEYTTRNLWNNKKIKHVKWSQKKKGDIIVYHNGSGVVNHVSLYIGNGKEIEALPGVGTITTRAGGNVKGVLRPIT